MKGKNNQHGAPVSPAMVEDKAAEERKKRALDAGLIVIANDGKSTKPKAVKKGGKK